MLSYLAIGVRLRRIEATDAEEHVQHTADRLVDGGLIDEPKPHRRREWLQESKSSVLLSFRYLCFVVPSLS